MWLWSDPGLAASAARMALRPLELLYRGAIAARNTAYDRHWLATAPVALPAISIGNLSVGGTGKTPVASWVASELVALGAAPAIVLRGYGDNEPLVHAALTPGVRVIVGADRVRGISNAAAAGADVAVLDDAFQHRRAARREDWVLVSADRWSPTDHCLPAGPLREPWEGLRRASLIAVTRKAATPEVAGQVLAAVTAAAPGIPTALIHLDIAGLRSLDGLTALGLDVLAGEAIMLIAAVGDPDALIAQVEPWARQVEPRIFPDHHRFSRAEILALAADAGAGRRVVCTLKDAVKLGEHWPRAGSSLWYVSQRVRLERGESAIRRALDELLEARGR